MKRISNEVTSGSIFSRHQRQEFETRLTPFLIVLGYPKPRIRRSKQKEEHGYEIEQAWPRVRRFSHGIKDELNVMHDKRGRAIHDQSI